ncbi:TetR/AcrR family transcriptional regulator; helix-turn-helix transcriptional regulator [Sphingobium sufflavum]|uniref:TetR/AcrR family transcriptional regulator n=1 Tax=Sphingobium sufflavum TaxID=1129547 RepID=UPI001F330CD7|nr:TetR/AcrR family transcriptional regulator [Sphingobium sufflavum]MCE7798881.1 TetR/AcrR family transcriptional regulator; helix-turn-helix transcriptional regulator [Sphingobium sufflavum]
MTQAIILDAAERLMLEEGYAAVTTRRVAECSGLKPPLVHYHFKTTDYLLTALYRRGAEQSLQRHASALAQDDPLTAIWRVNADGERTALALEFMAMANHRKFICEEISRYAEQIRAIQVAALERYLCERNLCARPPFGPLALSVMLAGAARALVMEKGVGIRLGHPELNAAIAELLQSYCVPADGGNVNVIA